MKVEAQGFAGGDRTSLDLPAPQRKLLERVQATPEVRVAVPIIEASVDTGLPGQGNVLILGVDMTGDRSLREYDLDEGEEAVVDDPLVFLAQPDSIIVSREFAARNHLAIDSRLALRTMEGDKLFTVRGIMKSGGLSQAFGGNLAVMDVYAAQKVFGRGRRFDRIDLGVKEGVRVEDCRAALERMLGPGFQVEAPSGRGQQFESMLSAYSISANISSLFALFIGIFIIYNSFAIAVAQRRYEIGVLRALGASRQQVRVLFLIESAIAGLIGSALGILIGLLEARAMAGYIAGLLEGVYGVAQRADEVSGDPRLLAAAMTIGVLTSVIAAWIPARNAARVDPVHALQKGSAQAVSAGENRMRRWLALAIACAAAVCLLFGHYRPIFYTGYVLTVIGALLLTPTLALWLARLLRPLLAWLRPVEGVLAADSLIRSPRRTSGTVAALMLSLAIVIGFAGIARASYDSIFEWCQNSLNPDFFVMPSEHIASRQFRFPAWMGSEMKKIEGVEEVQQVRNPRITFRGTPITLIAVEAESLARRVHRRVIEGDGEGMFRLAGEGRGAILSENLSLLENIHVGDQIELPSPSGALRLPVVGVTRDFSDQHGTILIDRSLFVREWKDDSVNIFRVYLRPGADRDAAKQRILARFAGESRVFVLSNTEVRRYIMQLTDQWNALSYVQIAMALLVAMLGVANSMTVSIIDRRRELGVLQAVGGLRNQVRGTIWMEALAVAVIGLLLGMALGALNLYYSLQITRHDVVGFRLDYLFPYGIAALLWPAILLAAFVSALWPGEAAVRASLVEALEYE